MIKDKIVQNIIFGLSLLTLFIFVISPIISILIESTLLNYVDIINVKTLNILINSIKLASIVALLSTIIGGFFAYLLTKTDISLGKFYKLLLLSPLFISPYILTLAWVDFFNLFSSGRDFIYSFWGVVLVHTFVFSPLAMIVISNGLLQINSRLEESALMFCEYKDVLFQIVIPLIKPSIVSSLILIFTLSISEFSVPIFLSVEVLTTEIFREFSAFYNYSLAVANSIILLFISIFLLLGEQRIISNSLKFQTSSTISYTKVLKLKRYKNLFKYISLLYIFISIIIPILVLLSQSLQDINNLYKAFNLLSPHILNSLLYALIGSFFLTIFGFIFAYISRVHTFMAKYIDTILLLTFAIPSTVLGIGLIKFFNKSSLDFIYSTFWIIIIAYFGKFIFISYKIIQNSLKEIPNSIEESALILGAGFFTRVQKIYIPLLSNSLKLTVIITFILSLGELGATILVYPAGSSVMGIKIYTIMANAPIGLTSAMSLVLLVVTIMALMILNLFLY